MTPIEFFLFIAIGCAIGFLAGLFGVGGGVLIVPLLIFFYEYSGISPAIMTHMAIGTSLFVVVFASLMSAYQHNKQKNIDWRAVFVLGFSSALTALAMTRLAADLSGRLLQVIFALVVLITALIMLMESDVKAQRKMEAPSRLNLLGFGGLGLMAGVVSALTGVGGGVFVIPIMYNFLKMPIKLAIGTSSAAIVITALFSVTGYIVNGLNIPDLPAWSIGFVDLQRGIVLAIGSVLLARAGAYVSFKTHPLRLKKLFALFVILISIYILVK
ncbi:MAG: sulfite exporter TauE/SafE family protein [Thermodesulfobacteriota bacterium]|nr:sulfite exporter TauE/SafE family protein [Thermodesulfobacteriota bacterium]